MQVLPNTVRERVSVFHAWPAWMAVVLGLPVFADEVETKRADVNRAVVSEPSNSDDVERLKARAERGDPNAEYAVGQMHLKGKGLPADFEKAIKWTVRAAEHGHVEAQCLLGVYFSGLPGEENSKRAAYWFQKAAEAGSNLGQYAMGCLLFDGQGVPQDYEAGVRWFRKSAEAAGAGNEASMVELGKAYMIGRGVEQNQSEGLRWILRAAEKGLAEAQAAIGYAYFDGTGVEKSEAKAVEWFRKAAEQQSPLGQCSLGVAYQSGRGVPQSFPIAVNWYNKSANQGNALAQFQLGRMMHAGEGTNKDIGRGTALLLRSANQGWSQAQLFLGAVYCEGRGVPQDFVDGYKWLNLASAQGDVSARKLRDQVMRMMTKEQLEEGQKRAAAFNAILEIADVKAGFDVKHAPNPARALLPD